MFTQTAKPMRIIDDSDNQRPDKLSSIVYFFICKYNVII